MTLQEMLLNEIARWEKHPEVVKAIKDWYEYSGQVITIWQRGATYNVEVNWVYSQSEAHGNERPGSKIGDIVRAHVGKRNKKNLDDVRYLIGLED